MRRACAPCKVIDMSRSCGTALSSSKYSPDTRRLANTHAWQLTHHVRQINTQQAHGGQLTWEEGLIQIGRAEWDACSGRCSWYYLFGRGSRDIQNALPTTCVRTFLTWSAETPHVFLKRCNSNIVLLEYIKIIRTPANQGIHWTESSSRRKNTASWVQSWKPRDILFDTVSYLRRAACIHYSLIK